MVLLQDNEPTAVARLSQNLPHLQQAGSVNTTKGFKLSDAQLVIAREYGFPSWPKLKSYVQGLSDSINPQQQVLDEALIRAAIKQKDLAQVQELLAAGANVNGRLAEVGTTVLGWAACGAEHVAMMQFLLAQGAQVDLPANGGFTALSSAAVKGNMQAVKLLLAHGADVNHAQPGNYTVLHGGTYSGSTEVVRLLIEAGAQVNTQTTSGRFGAYWFHLPYCGETPLHNAMAYGSQEMIQLLLDAGADISIKTWHGETALHWAARHNRPKALMKWLRIFI